MTPRFLTAVLEVKLKPFRVTVGLDSESLRFYWVQKELPEICLN